MISLLEILIFSISCNLLVTAFPGKGPEFSSLSDIEKESSNVSIPSNISFSEADEQAETFTLNVTMFGKVYSLNLEQHSVLVSGSLKWKYFYNNQSLTNETVDGCFFRGIVDDETDSLVVINRCNGIRGLVYFRNEMLILEPFSFDKNTSEKLTMYRVQRQNSSRCGNQPNRAGSYKQLHMAEYLRNVKIMKHRLSDYVNEARSVRLVLVADHRMVQNLNGSLLDVIFYFILVANIIDSFLKELEIRLKLVYAELWNERDIFDVGSTHKVVLQRFLNYRTRNLKELHFDVAHLIGGGSFEDGISSFAVPDSICSNRAVSISRIGNVDDYMRVASEITHSLAHILGIEHDTPAMYNSDAERGHLMNKDFSVKNISSFWSTSSVSEAQQTKLSRLSDCLLEKPSYHEKRFVQKCGNGVVERGEECDCLNADECREIDPCCDPKNCLLYPWTNCRRGDCCRNCTVLSSNHICRKQVGSCDVPEFCDGLHGECPVDVHLQDGQQCTNNDSYCYRGVCQSYNDHCKLLWGQDALVADDECFKKFNPLGNFNGHCGKNRTSGNHISCSLQDVKCGLLHCSGGSNEPNSSENLYSMTSIAINGVNYECKVVVSLLEQNRFPTMVVDGAICGNDSMCIDARCVPIVSVVKQLCPVGVNGQICSGRGRCTTGVQCFCFDNYTGADCSELRNETFFPIEIEMLDFLLFQFEDVAFNSTRQLSFELSTESMLILRSSSEGIPHGLVLALAITIAGSLLIFGLCLLLYRRKSPPREKVFKNKKSDSKILLANQLFEQNSERFGESIEERGRTISFGKMPSYRDFKNRKFASAYQKGKSDTDSERSHDSSERRLARSATLPLPPKPPGKGILKKKHPNYTSSSLRSEHRTKSVNTSGNSRIPDEGDRQEPNARRMVDALELQPLCSDENPEHRTDYIFDCPSSVDPSNADISESSPRSPVGKVDQPSRPESRSPELCVESDRTSESGGSRLHFYTRI